MLRFIQSKSATWLVAFFSLSLAGCAQDLERLNQELHAINTGTPRPSQTAAAPSQSVASSSEAQSQPTQLIMSNDKAVEAATEAALPAIKKVVALNRCMKNEDSLRLLNFHAVPGKSFQLHWNYPNSKNYLKYHDFNNCIAARTIDQWSMPALNMLRFRVVYFAEDSGETVNFQYEFKRVEDGSWKLDSIRPNVK
jgi:hypothetical protein